MNKKLVSLVSAVSILGMTVNVFADDTSYGPWKVSFDGTKITEYDTAGNATSFGGTDSIQNALNGMQPGDSVEITINVENTNKTYADWYLQNDVLLNFEDSTNASGGAYTYDLTYTTSTGGTNVLFSSDSVGGEHSSTTPTEAGEGLEEATNALDDYIFLEEMPSGKSGKVTLRVSLDGETQGNNYQVTAAKLNMLFAVEVPPTKTPEPKEEVIVRRQDRIIYLPNTGDDSNILLYIGAFFVSLYIMVYAGWRLKRASKGN